ncbi:unnamed protein product [Triticum turgidum subsp. durum]|uniref:Late embryogenesis abundant protein LEA-2 subgroup domain-containing protein n=1 Tax=Triticum turgidum subsp. durum TaxID=4567 RepID=A0A9R1PTN5_TRITD|nr:unnamed protein product [Triticum turgidum subsp. durum]
MAQGECHCSWSSFMKLVGFFVLFFGCTAAVLFLILWPMVSSRGPEYTVAITSVDGLDPARDLHGDRPALSPVFGITVHVDNTREKVLRACVGVDSFAVVSYGDVLLGRGSVPSFCAEKLGVCEVAATAWGMDVHLPHFLRDRLAGELERGQVVVDVTVRSPGGDGCYINGCLDKVIICKAKIGGGPSRCFVTETASGTTTKG